MRGGADRPHGRTGEEDGSLPRPRRAEHGNATWFDRFGGLAPGDDALPLLSTSCKPYRKLIDTNTISIFDFRSYLFARQAFMLFHLDRVVEVARRGAYFVSTFARKLRENEASSPPARFLHGEEEELTTVTSRHPSVKQATLGVSFVESWTYSACLDIVAACEAKLAAQSARAPSVALVAVKAELLELAKKQVTDHTLDSSDDTRSSHSSLTGTLMTIV